MSFAKLIGNERNKAVLQRLLARGRVGATLVFAGPEGIGKRQFALTVAKAANCLSAPTDGFAQDSCDVCAVCKRIDAGEYGDVVTIAPDGQFIKIAQTRALAAEVYARPREGRQRFFLIDGAERLREEAANSLLKTLEEPPPTSSLILLTARPSALLPTINSRAQRLNFTPLRTDEMEKYLVAVAKRPAVDAALLARVTEGRIGQAATFDLAAYRQDRTALLGMLELLAAGENKFRLLKAAEYLGKKERDDFERQLSLLDGLLRDLLLLASGCDAKQIMNLDAATQLNALGAKLNLNRLTTWIEEFGQLRANLRININRQVATEAALMTLAQT